MDYLFLLAPASTVDSGETVKWLSCPAADYRISQNPVIRLSKKKDPNRIANSTDDAFDDDALGDEFGEAQEHSKGLSPRELFELDLAASGASNKKMFVRPDAFRSLRTTGDSVLFRISDSPLLFIRQGSCIYFNR